MAIQWKRPGRADTARHARVALAFALAVLVGACAVPGQRTVRGAPGETAAEARARIAQLVPDGVADRAGWATDIVAALRALDIAATTGNACAAIAVIGQESSFQVDPPIPGLPAIARKALERERERAGIPRLVLDAALALTSSDGRTYAARLDAVHTERELSDIYDDFIGRVPLGRTFLADRNPVRTAGPMQVSVEFAADYVADRPYPYPVQGSIRRELFTRRGGVYFGIAHLLDYPAPYDRMRYRFADFNAGRYASRNAAFQSAVTEITGIPLALDGDLLRYEGARPARDPGNTELAVRTLARRIGVDDADVRRDLERSREAGFERTRVYEAVFAMADDMARRRVPRAVIPRIALESPKITRALTTQWFADRVEARHRACLARAARSG